MADDLQDVFTYEEYRSLFLNKPFFQNDFGIGWQEAMGAAWDAEIVNLKAAAKVGFPLLTPSDALPWLGLERGLEQILPTLNQAGESEQVYRTRLQQAWNEWAIMGTVGGHQQWASWMQLPARVYRQHEWGPGADPHGEWVNGRSVTLPIALGAFPSSKAIEVTEPIPPWGGKAPAMFLLHDPIPFGTGALNVTGNFFTPPRLGLPQIRVGLGGADRVKYTLSSIDIFGAPQTEVIYASGQGVYVGTKLISEATGLTSDVEPGGTTELGLTPGLSRTAKITFSGGPSPPEDGFVTPAVAAGDQIISFETTQPDGGLKNGGHTQIRYHTGWIYLWPTFWIVINQPHPWFVVKIGQLAPWKLKIGDGKWTIGSSATPAEVARLVRLCDEFKSAHSTPIEIILAPVGGWIISPDAGPIGAMGLVIGGSKSMRLLAGEKWWSLTENGVERFNA